MSGGPGRDVVDAGPGADRIVVQYDGSRDSVRCGPGSDVVNADLVDRIAADCELVGRRLSRDPYTGPEAQHESEVEPDSLTVGRTTVATFQVGRRFSGAADNVGFAVSTDNGSTWRSGLLPGLTRVSVPAGPNERASDPVVAYDAVNRVWLIATLALEGQTTRLTVSRSTDGFTWSAPVTAIEDSSANGITFDKNWIACDNGAASPHRGRCYLVYTDTLRNDRLAAITSTDGGTAWSAPVGIPVTDAVGAFPVIRPRGRARRRLPLVWEPPRVVGLDGRSGELRPAGCHRGAPGSIDPRAAPLSSSLSRRGSIRARVDHLARLPLQLGVCPEQRGRRDVRRRSHLEPRRPG